MEDNSGVTIKIGFGGLLAIVFSILKLLGVINWSWGVVLAPIWLPVVVITIFFIVVEVISKS